MRAIARALSPDQAQVVLLRLLCDLDVEHVAQILGKRPGTVRVLQYEALRRLAANFFLETGNAASPERDFTDGMNRYPIDDVTADRLVSGQVAPADAAPAHAGLAALILSATAQLSLLAWHARLQTSPLLWQSWPRVPFRYRPS